MNDFEIQEESAEIKKKRPVFLLVLVILSSLNIGVATIGALSGMLGAQPDKAMMATLPPQHLLMKLCKKHLRWRIQTVRKQMVLTL